MRDRESRLHKKEKVKAPKEEEVLLEAILRRLKRYIERERTHPGTPLRERIKRSMITGCQVEYGSSI